MDKNEISGSISHCYKHAHAFFLFFFEQVSPWWCPLTPVADQGMDINENNTVSASSHPTYTQVNIGGVSNVKNTYRFSCYQKLEFFFVTWSLILFSNQPSNERCHTLTYLVQLWQPLYRHWYWQVGITFWCPDSVFNK